MMNRVKKISAIMVAAALIMTSVCHSDSGMTVQATIKSAKIGKAVYTITSKKKREARFDRPSNKSIKSLSIPATVKIGKVTYKVTSIKSNSLSKCRNLRKLTIGKNVKKIGKKGICCKSLKTVIIKTPKLTMESVSKKAFKLNSKAVVIVPNSKLTSYQKLLKARGVKGKNQVIKSNKPTATDSPKKPVVIPDPEVRFAIGELSNKNRNDFWAETKTDASFALDDNVKFSLSIKMPQEMYGSWGSKKRKITGKYTRCVCGKCFENDTSDYGIHAGQTGHGGYQIVSAIGQTVSMWYWTPDKTPCSIVYRITLPAGISYYESSAELYDVTRMGILEPVSNDRYTVTASGNSIIITVKDIKLESNNGAVIHPFVATVRAKIEETAADVNQVNADITYNYGSGDKVVTMNPVFVRKK